MIDKKFCFLIALDWRWRFTGCRC